MKGTLKKIGIGFALTLIYLIMFATITKFTGILTLILGAIGIYYVYFKNEKYKDKKLFKILFGIAIAFFMFVFGLGGIAYNPDLAASKLEQSNINDDEVTKEDNQVATNDTEETTNKTTGDSEGENTAVTNNTEAEIHFINTGNSDSIVIKQGDNSVLIDAGDNDDESAIVNYLKNLGINKLSYVISTHPDADHCGGLDAVFNNFNIENLFVGNGSSDSKTYSDFINAAANKGINPSVPLEGSEYKLTDTSYLKIYNAKGIAGNSNESSLVTLFVNGKDKILLMGDAGAETEAKLINTFENVDLLKIGHHGSSSSTTQAFLDKVNPKSAVILVGKGNKYGHPSSDVMSRLQAKGIGVHRTDECGNIVYKSTGNGLTTTCGVNGTYNAGNKNETSTSGGSTSGSGGSTGGSTSGGSVTTNEPEKTDRTVYWTSKGKSYHYDINCRTLARSKNILQGPGSQCPKTDPCNVCVK